MISNKVAMRELVNTEKGLIERRIYTDQDIYEQELEQVWGRCWVGIGHESQVPGPNDFIANYIGEDPVLVTRDAKGKVHAFLNMCRHRGNRVCRADVGNAPSFMCTYHGWTYATDGKLVGVPGYKEAYFEELDRSQWGLVEAHCDNYKGLIFGNWDKNAPPLLDYLGDFTWYMDMLLDRREGGVEFLPGIERRVIPCNWKIPVDNHFDNYHFPVTHGSGLMINRGNRNLPVRSYYDPNPNQMVASTGNGHVMGGHLLEGSTNLGATGTNQSSRVVGDYYMEHIHEIEQRLGHVRAHQGGGRNNIFPATNWNGSRGYSQVRLRHPRGPGKTEVWTYVVVDKKAPSEVKEAAKRAHVFSMGPAGMTEQDDLNNWFQVSASGNFRMGRQQPMNFQLALGRRKRSELAPGLLTPDMSEVGQLDFYGRWAEMMDAPSWDGISIAPKTIKP